MVPSPNLGVQERSDLPPEQQPPRGARRYCGARPLSTANVAGGLKSANMSDLDWTLSVPLHRSWLEVCRWITSLAGGSSCRGNVGWLDNGPKYTALSTPQTAYKMVRNSDPRRYNLLIRLRTPVRRAGWW